MPRLTPAEVLEAELEREANGIIEALIRKAQEKVAAAGRPQTAAPRDGAEEGGIIEEMIALAVLDPLNHYELTAIRGLIFYVSKTQNLPEKSVHGLLEYKFRVENIEALRRQDFHLVMECLTDLLDSKGMN